jgi:hypothetical protein
MTLVHENFKLRDICGTLCCQGLFRETPRQKKPLSFRSEHSSGSDGLGTAAKERFRVSANWVAKRITDNSQMSPRSESHGPIAFDKAIAAERLCDWERCMICKWIKSGKGFFSTTAAGQNGELYHLIVERVPGKSRDRAWDWATWCAEWSKTTARHGYASSAKAGMAAAESVTAAELIGPR